MRNRSRQQPPSPSLPSGAQTLAFWRHPHAYLEWCRRRYGSAFTVKAVGMAPMVFMSDPAHIKTILGAPADVLHPGAGGRAVAPLVGDGSFMLAEEEVHLAGRRAILPAFHNRVVQEHADMVREIAEREIAGWPRGVAFSSHPYLRALTLRVILLSVFGREDARLPELHARLLAMFSISASLMLQVPQLRSLQAWRGVWRRFLLERARVEHILAQLIQDDACGRARDCGLLEVLLDGEPDGDQTNVTRLRETLMSVILAGHETTAAELAWAFQLLAHDPLIARDLSDDLAVGRERYLTATIHEVLRHRPVFLFAIPRVVRRPFEVGGITYRPPVQLVGCIHLVHHDADLYPEPYRFRPARFLDAPARTEVWIPWGGGRKRCPGRHLAILEMRTVLETVLRDFELLPASGKIETARWRSVIVTPARGSRIMLCKRPRGRLRGRAQLRQAQRS